MTLSLSLSLVAFYFSLSFMPLERLGMTPNFGPGVVLATLAIFLPFILVGSALMTLVASFTKSYREAQTWLSVVLIAPTMPILIVSILMLRPRTEFMFIPPQPAPAPRGHGEKRARQLAARCDFGC